MTPRGRKRRLTSCRWLTAGWDGSTFNTRNTRTRGLNLRRQSICPRPRIRSTTTCLATRTCRPVTTTMPWPPTRSVRRAALWSRSARLVRKLPRKMPRQRWAGNEVMPIAVGELAELESVLGHEFREPGWLLQALTHSSRIPERTVEDSPGDNEKLEFLGDAVLELIVSEELVRRFPDWREGQLSKSRARLVNATAISLSAQRLGIGKYLRLGRGEEKTGGPKKTALLADAYEALIAAIYLDGGLEAARGFVRRTLVEGAIAGEAESMGHTDHKSALQELLQSRGMAPGIYHVIAESGPDHQKTFRVEVRICGQVTAMGSGRTKKEAEQSAAVAALIQLGVEDNRGTK